MFSGGQKPRGFGSHGMSMVKKIFYIFHGVGDNSQFEPLLVNILSHFNKLMEAYQSDSDEDLPLLS